MRREASGGWPSSGRVSRLGRRSVLRAGAGVAAGLLVGAEQRQAQAVPVRQSGSLTLGGRWVEAEGFAWRSAEIRPSSSHLRPISPSTRWPQAGGEGDPGIGRAALERRWCDLVRADLDRTSLATAGPTGMAASSAVSSPRREPRFYYYRTYDSAGNFAPLPGFEIDYIDATAGPSLEQIANPALAPVFSPPPLITRAAWGADEVTSVWQRGRGAFPDRVSTGRARDHPPRRHRNLNDPVLEMRSIYYFHAVTRGWGDIAYNYLVDFMGNVCEGRVGGEGAVGCHAEGHNAGSCVSVLWAGSSTTRQPRRCTTLSSGSPPGRPGLDPTGGAPFLDIGNLPTICGHRDVNNTTCPGDEFYMQLDTVRTEARRVIRGRDDPEPPPPQWHPGMRVLTNAEGASLRTGPGIDFDVATKVAFGEPLLVLQGPTTNDSTIWYEVQGVSLTGWVAGNLLTPDPDPVPLDPLPTETPVTAAPPDTATPVPTGEARRRLRSRSRRRSPWKPRREW